MRKVEIERKKLSLKDDIEVFFEKVVTKFGTGAKIDCPRRYIGRSVYVIVRKEGADVR